ncbi:Gfo/Idh/MocA family protein [Pseudonocardia xinjiangensis]|uniref:Gfo/Idh/MocA family oxidoreductase n=1 Tax=Pseudonocardia xinjiangensis TaxID=75289 RepID=A0ABX1RDX4_9PSEU|nr:Gfo/Idh/MocA family oxidoreductase [Pseudonocardia xinjiangensis]NMH77629.1 Gfo/Idh/MocA family oxidoreductase [Pseudonocardia xinjiangensis]
MGLSEKGPIRLGLIGTGLAVEKLHWPALRRLADRYVVTAFADHSVAQGERFSSYSGVDMAGFTTDHHRLLARDDVDAVLISVPIPSLYEVAQDSLAAGKDVLCEKPAGTDEDQARAFLALEERYPQRTVLIGENYFYRDDIRHARALLDDGAIGKLHLMAWRRARRLVPWEGVFAGTPWRHRPQYRGGVHLDAGVHDIAQIRMLCGDAVRVHGAAQWANSTIEAPSDLTLNLVFACGAIGNYTATYSEIAVPKETEDLRLYGTEGVLVLSGPESERQVTLTRADGSTQTDVFRGIDNGYHAELCNFSDAVRHGEPVVGTVRQSVANMLIVLRALDSAEQDTVMALDDAPPGGGGVPLWRPRGGSGLFDGLPGERSTRTAISPVDRP